MSSFQAQLLSTSCYFSLFSPFGLSSPLPLTFSYSFSLAGGPPYLPTYQLLLPSLSLPLIIFLLFISFPFQTLISWQETLLALVRALGSGKRNRRNASRNAK
jgi:hypothetical protein